jgi:hypothetical protein
MRAYWTRGFDGSRGFKQTFVCTGEDDSDKHDFEGNTEWRERRSPREEKVQSGENE